MGTRPNLQLQGTFLDTQKDFISREAAEWNKDNLQRYDNKSASAAWLEVRRFLADVRDEKAKADKPRKKANPVEFLQQVRAEGAKTTWPTRKETGITTVMVFIMVAIASVFFLLVDLVLQFGVGQILNLGG